MALSWWNLVCSVVMVDDGAEGGSGNVEWRACKWDSLKARTAPSTHQKHAPKCLNRRMWLDVACSIQAPALLSLENKCCNMSKTTTTTTPSAMAATAAALKRLKVTVAGHWVVVDRYTQRWIFHGCLAHT